LEQVSDTGLFGLLLASKFTVMILLYIFCPIAGVCNIKLIERSEKEIPLFFF